MLYLSNEKNENKQKEAGFGPFKKEFLRIFLSHGGGAKIEASCEMEI